MTPALLSARIDDAVNRAAVEDAFVVYPTAEYFRQVMEPQTFVVVPLYL